MRMATISSAVCLSVVLLLAAGGRAFDVPTSRAAGIGQTAVLSRPTAAELLNAAHGLDSSGQWVFDAGYLRRFEMKELDRVFVAGAVRWRGVTLGIGAAQFGESDLYAEQTLRSALTVAWRRLSFGLTGSAQQIQIGNGYGDLRAATVGFGLTYRHSKLIATLTGDELTRPTFADGSLPREALLGLLTEYVGARSWSLTGRVVAQKNQKPRFGLGQMIRLSRRGAFMWGISTEPLELGAGLEVFIPSGSITYAAGIHHELGLTHTVTLSLGSSLRWLVEPKGTAIF